MRTASYRDSRGLYRCTECGVAVDICVCVNVEDMAHERLHSADGVLSRLIRDELHNARQRFPPPDKTLVSLGEEYGELCQAMLDHDRDGSKTPVQVLREAVQVAAMAIRVATEGDIDFKYEFPRPVEN